jgi:hypothetical protein
MGYLKSKPRKRKAAALDIVSVTQQMAKALNKTSLTDLQIVNPKFTIRIKRNR